MFYMSTPTLRFRNTGLNLRSIPIVLYLIGLTEFSTGIPHPTKVLVVSENLVIYYEQRFLLEAPLSLYQHNANGKDIQTHKNHYHFPSILLL